MLSLRSTSQNRVVVAGYWMSSTKRLSGKPPAVDDDIITPGQLLTALIWLFVCATMAAKYLLLSF